MPEIDADALNIRITGGEGVGQVTLPGLEIPPGQAAINLGPRKMIVQAIEEVLGEQPVNADGNMLRSLCPKEGFWLKKP